jgi:cysteine desulfurase
MYANNEIGTVQPIMEIAKEIRHFRKNHQVKIFPLFHTDATQAINYLPIKVEKLGVDLMSFNGGKIYGPKGIGVLYVKRKIPINKILFGGDQEFGLRPGTENVGMIAGLVEALKITEKIKEREVERLTKLRDYFIEKLEKKDNVRQGKFLSAGESVLFSLNGDSKKRLPNNVNITIPKIPSDLLVLELSARGIYISEKSACKSGDKAGSYVIRALQQTTNKVCKKSEGSLRFSLGRQTIKTDIDHVLKSLSEILEKLEKWY